MKYIIVSVGHTAAGKTTTLRKISNKYGYHFISEGKIKRDMVGEGFGINNSMDENLRSRGYKKAIEEAFLTLEKEDFVIIDASFHQQFRRNWIYGEIKAHNIECSVIWVYCYCNDKKMVRERIKKRAESKVVTADIQARSMKVYNYTMATFDAVDLNKFDQDIPTAIIYNNTSKMVIDKIVSNDRTIESLARDIAECFYKHKIYFARHSVSYFNEGKIYAGNQDIPLSKKGINDSIKLGNEFKKKFPNANIDIIITSKLSRAIETATLMISQLRLKKIPIIVDRNKINSAKDKGLIPFVEFEELNERDYGDLQYLTEEQIRAKYDLKTLTKWRRNFYGKPNNGESFEQVVCRVAKAYFEYIKPLSLNNDILIVGHQNTLRALYYLIFNVAKKDMEKIEFGNSEFWVYDHDRDDDKIINYNALVMASGKGTRMEDLTKSLPKPLLPVNGRELVSYQLDFFKNNHFDFTVTYSYLKDAWKSFIESNDWINFCYTNEDLSYWECMLEAYKNTKNKSNYFVIIGADLVFDYNLINKTIEDHITHNNQVTVAMNSTSGKWKKWRYVYNESGDIADIIIENTVQNNERFFMVFNKEELDRFASEAEKGLYEKENQYGNGANYIIKKMLELGTRVSCVEYNDNYLLNVNNKAELAKAEEFYKNNK